MGILPLPTEDWATVGRRIASAEGPIAWSWAAARSQTGEWKAVVLTVRGATSIHPQHLPYDALVLHTEELSPTSAPDRFLAASTGPAPAFPDGLSLSSSGSTMPFWMTTEPQPRYYLSHPEWPEYYFNYTVGSSGDVSLGMQDLVNRRGQPFYPTVQAAFADILYGVPPTDLQTNFNPHVLVRLPDLRGRFGQTRFDGGSVLLSIEEGRAGGSHGCLILVAWRRGTGDKTWDRAELSLDKPGIAILETGEIPAEMWALLVDSTGNVLD